MTVDFGYDLYSISIEEAVFARIQAGEPVAAAGQGFPVEGVLEQDRWMFNHGAVGAVHVFTDEGREVFEGDLEDDEVVIHHP